MKLVCSEIYRGFDDGMRLKEADLKKTLGINKCGWIHDENYYVYWSSKAKTVWVGYTKIYSKVINYDKLIKRI